MSTSEFGHDEPLDWLNALVRKLWPRIDKAIQKIIHDSITPKLQAAMPVGLNNVWFHEFTLGEHTPPLLGPVRVCKASDGVKLVVGVDYRSAEDIELSFMGVPVGVKNLEVAGEVCIRLTQPIDEMPIIGGLIFYFMDPPSITFGFAGLGHLADLPGIGSVIRHAVDAAVAGLIVLPNQLAVPLADESQGIDIARMKTASPLGVLYISPTQAWQLGNAGIMGAKNHNPYVYAQMADDSWRSQAATNMCNPVWPEEQNGGFMIFDREQRVWLSVYDDDELSGGDLLGQARGLTVEEALAMQGPMKLYPRGAPESGLVGRPEEKIRRSCMLQANSLATSCVGMGRTANPNKSLGSLGVHFEFAELVPSQICGSECVLRINVDEIRLPRSAGEDGVKMTAKIGQLAAKSTPVGSTSQSFAKVEDAQLRKRLKGVVERLHQKKMPPNEIAEVMSLPLYVVMRVLGGKTMSRDDISGMSKVVEIKSIIYLLLPVAMVYTDKVILTVATSADETVVAASVDLSEVAAASGLEIPGPLQLGPGVEAAVGLQLLGTRTFSRSARSSGGCEV